MAIVGTQLTGLGLPAIRRCHMHAGKRPCGLFSCGEAADVQVEGLDALENAAGPDCLRLARHMLSERPHR